MTAVPDAPKSEATPVRSSIRAGVLLLALFVLLAFALRVLRLDFQPLWWDEGYSVWFATHPLGQMAALTAQDIHPPLYYVLLHGWIGLLGAGPVSLRLLSVLFGVLAIPAIYLAGRRMLSRRAALLAAFLLAISPLHVYYSQEVRMYGLVAPLSIGVLAAAWQTMERISESANQQINKSANQQISKSPRHPVTLSPRHLVTYVLLTTAALYTQYYAIFLPIGLTLYAVGVGGATRPAGALAGRTDRRRRALLAVGDLRSAETRSVRLPEGRSGRRQAARPADVHGTSSGGVHGRASGRAAGGMVAGSTAGAFAVVSRLGVAEPASGRTGEWGMGDPPLPHPPLPLPNSHACHRDPHRARARLDDQPPLPVLSRTR